MAWDEDDEWLDFDGFFWEPGVSFEDLLADLPTGVWHTNSGQDIEIIDMKVPHARNVVRMLAKWVKEGRGASEADIVGAERFENLKRRANDPDDELINEFTEL